MLIRERLPSISCCYDLWRRSIVEIIRATHEVSRRKDSGVVHCDSATLTLGEDWQRVLTQQIPAPREQSRVKGASWRLLQQAQDEVGS